MLQQADVKNNQQANNVIVLCREMAWLSMVINQVICSYLKQEGHEHHRLDNRAETVQRQANKTGLPDNLKSGMSLDHVRVSYNSAKPVAVQAHAYAQGSNIHLASGHEKHLPHELGHVVQQAQGRVSATTSVGGMAVNDSPAMEQKRI